MELNGIRWFTKGLKTKKLKLSRPRFEKLNIKHYLDLITPALKLTPEAKTISC